MAGVNKVILVGNLGRDPEVMTFENGVKKASFSIATTESYKDKEGNKIDQTEWHNIVLWRGLAEVAERFLRKGSQIYLEGKIKTRSYEVNGVKKYITEILGDNMQMLGRRDAQDEQGQQQYQQQSAPPSPAEDNSGASEEGPSDDLPF
jgi:single-strand DNA-binding protein